MNGKADVGLAAVVDVVFDRAAIEASPEDWIEIPKLGCLGRRDEDDKDEFIRQFLRDNGIEAFDETEAVVSGVHNVLREAFLRGLNREAPTVAAAIGAIENFCSIGDVEALARMGDVERARWLMSQLRCWTEVIPDPECCRLELPQGSSFAAAARRLLRKLDA